MFLRRLCLRKHFNHKPIQKYAFLMLNFQRTLLTFPRTKYTLYAQAKQRRNAPSVCGSAVTVMKSEVIMKRLYSLLSIFVYPLLLSSCDIHFGSKHYDVPWYFVLILALLLLILPVRLLISENKRASKTKYTCTKCGEAFYPVKKINVGGLSNTAGYRLLRCPYCGNFDEMPPSREQ